ncbi:hypothetical protein [Vulgatibacter incomptus]|uniref:hypothetical protein n=1 Tax=Vulgatibacter incomptus TaxID=1391653 RepID=UPI0006824DD8|nr:hypothetical protein [Vulgatibacter incomptus]
MTFQDALIADRAGDLQLAASRYEELISQEEAPFAVLMNLAVLYWQATDPGMVGAKSLTPNFSATASRRIPELLTEAERRFSGRSEPRFWRRYIDWADLGDPFCVDECFEFLLEDPESLVPAMHIFAFSRGKDAESEAIELLQQCRDDMTTRSRYIASVIEGVLRRSARR